MRKIKIICSLIILLNVSYVEARPSVKQLDGCQKEGAAYGDGKGASFISDTCYAQFKSMASPNAVKQSADGIWSVMGYRNMVFVNKHNEHGLLQGLFAGSQTQLKLVIAVALDEVNKEVAVLDHSGDVLFFSMDITGNVSPLRTLRAAELKGAAKLEINPKTNEVIITNPQSGLVLFFSRLANINGREGAKKLSLIKSNPI